MTLKGSYVPVRKCMVRILRHLLFRLMIDIPQKSAYNKCTRVPPETVGPLYWLEITANCEKVWAVISFCCGKYQ